MKHQLFLSILLTALPCVAQTSDGPFTNDADGVHGGYEYVDLGLPSGTCWATCNIGAESPYETGSYFAWGEVEPREDFSWESYSFYLGYEIDHRNGAWCILQDIGDEISGTEYDAARHQWGNGWRLPNKQEAYELRMMCWSEYTVENGVAGMRVHGPNEHSIFLRAGGQGLWEGEMDPYDSMDSYYMTGKEWPENGYNGRQIEPSTRAESILSMWNNILQVGDVCKAAGICVRPVFNRKGSGTGGIASGVSSVLAYREGVIHVFGDCTDGTVNVHDLSGRIAYSGQVMNAECRLPNLSYGMYIVTLVNGASKLATLKISVK